MPSRPAAALAVALLTLAPAALAGDLFFTLRQDAGADLYRLRKGGAERVHAPLPAGREVVSVDRAPAERHLVFRADVARDGVHDLHHADLEQDVVTPVHALDDGRTIHSMTFARKGARLVFVDAETSPLHSTGTETLWSADLTAGGPAVRLADPFDGDGRLRPVTFSRDGRTLYAWGIADDDSRLLFEVDVATGAWSPLAAIDGVATGTGTGRWLRRVAAWRADGEGGSTLLVLDTKSGALDELSLDHEIVFARDDRPDDRWIAYTASDEGVLSRRALDIVDGTQVVLPGEVPGAQLGSLVGVGFGPKGRRVVYGARPIPGDPERLHVVDLETGTTDVLDVEVRGAILLDRKGRTAVLRAADLVEGLPSEQLLEVDLVTLATRRLNPPLPLGSTLGSFALSPKGRHLVYVANHEQAGRHELFRVDRKTGAVDKISGDTALAEFEVRQFAFDGKKALAYVAGHVDADSPEVRRWTPKSGVAETVHEPLVPGGSVNWLQDVDD